jgi:hypothetical protein
VAAAAAIEGLKSKGLEKRKKYELKGKRKSKKVKENRKK